MVLGFLGKGGSGKSTVATQTALFLLSQNKSVLAIDADHNMDLTYNLVADHHIKIPYLSSSLTDMLQYVASNSYREVFLEDASLPRFTLTPPDSVTDKYSVVLPNRIRLMTAGPQTDTVLYGQSCSHSLTTPLKVYLPLLNLVSHEVAIVDEKAGADGVTTGIVTGIDVGIIVCEPALHSIKTAKQIAELMNFYQTPYLFVGNKIHSDEDRKFIQNTLGEIPALYLTANQSIKQNPTVAAPDWEPALSELIQKSTALNNHSRLLRTKAKFLRDREFAHQ